MRRTLVVMAEAPIPGAVKTQLIPPLSPAAAAELHECCILDVLSKAAAVPDVELVVAYTPEGTESYFRDAAPGASAFLPQEGDDLGGRMAVLFEELCEPGRSVAVIGSDAPTLPALCLELAFDVLASRQVDVIFGPSGDGAHYLVGMNAYHASLFRGVDWGSSRALRQSVDRAARIGLDWYLLPEWHDIGCPADLAYLRGELLERCATGPSARHTRGLLKELVESGVI